MSYKKVLTVEKINPLLVEAEYAVRGAIPIRSDQIKDELAKNPSAFPFTQVVQCNIGNPQQLGQKPITFFRQVMALLDYPDLLSEQHIAKTEAIFPADAIARAREYLKGMAGLGAYSHSKGVSKVREEVAAFIKERDGFDADPENIFLTDGASPAVAHLLYTLIAHPKVGIMIPIPQYPLYSATISLCHGLGVPYYLDESKNWDLSLEELNSSLAKAKAAGVEVRALAVINPGNPTGQCLSIESMRGILKFCHANSIVLLADEVYQGNVYYPEVLPFHSFKKVMKTMPGIADELELISFHSVSKGVIGECGRRGGYMELVNVSADIVDQIYKKASISLCSNVAGQITVGLMVNPPKPGQPSYELYKKESTTTFDSLKRRAEKLVKSLNELEGVTCNTAQGAMYSFAQIRLPALAVERAKAQGMAPDAYYCMALLNATGVCVVPGSGFQQKDGTHHFRCTFLPPEKDFDAFLGRIRDFHQAFFKEHKSSSNM